MIDWNLLVIKLSTKKPMTDIAKELNIDCGKLHRMSRGIQGEPKFTLGLALLDLYFDYFPDSLEDIKIGDRYL